MPIFNLSRRFRFPLLGGLYSIVSLASFMAAYYIRFDGNVPREYLDQMLQVAGWAVVAQAGIMVATGQASVLSTYFSMVDRNRPAVLSITHKFLSLVTCQDGYH